LVYLLGLYMTVHIDNIEIGGGVEARNSEEVGITCVGQGGGGDQRCCLSLEFLCWVDWAGLGWGLPVLCGNR
jgi:hypothetical protein